METMTIKEAARRLGVEAHVLRYWEDELGLTIKRSSVGHRYYDSRDIEMFKRVQMLKENGLALKDIKQGIKDKREKHLREHGECEASGLEGDEQNTGEREADTAGEDDRLKVVDFKQAQLQTVMNKIIANALKENRHIITDSIKNEITSDVICQFDTVMREKEEREEARYKRLDEMLRQLQLANEEVAAARVGRLFRKRR